MAKKKSEDKRCGKDNVSCKPKKSLSDSIRQNFWILATLVLGILSLILVLGNFFGGVTGLTIVDNVISKQETISFSADDAGKAVIDFAAVQGIEVELLKVTEDFSFYEVLILIEGQELPVYITKDGEYIAQALIPVKEAMDTMRNQVSTNFSN